MCKSVHIFKTSNMRIRNEKPKSFTIIPLPYVNVSDKAEE